MLNQVEIVSTTVCLIVSAVLLTVIIFRTRNIYLNKNARVPIWNEKVSMFYRVSKLALAVSLLLMTLGVIYFIFITALPTAVIREYAKTSFCIVFSAFAALEAIFCFSISEKLLKGSLLRRLSFFGAVVFSVIAAAYLFPLIPKSLAYPAEQDCLLLELPVRGIWLARHAGASRITNGHHPRHAYAIDILKLGPDGRLR